MLIQSDGQISKQEWLEMTTNYDSSVGAILRNECPEEMNIDTFRQKVVSGEISLSQGSISLISELKQPLLNYARFIAEEHEISVETEEELLFLSKFPPDALFDEEIPVEQTAATLTMGEVVECVLIALGVDFLFAAGVTQTSTKWTIKAISKSFGKIASRMFGPIGTAIAIATFGYCLYEQAED